MASSSDEWFLAIFPCWYPKNRQIFGLLFVLQIKKTNTTQIKKWSFCMRIRVSAQTNHFFGNTNTQKTDAKEKNLCTEEKPSFVYLCIGVSGQRNHSLSFTDNN